MAETPGPRPEGEKQPTRREIIARVVPAELITNVGPNGITDDYANELYGPQYSMRMPTSATRRDTMFVNGLRAVKTYTEYWEQKLATYNATAEETGTAPVNVEACMEVLVNTQPGAADLDMIAEQARRLADSEGASIATLGDAFQGLYDEAITLTHPEPEEQQDSEQHTLAPEVTTAASGRLQDEEYQHREIEVRPEVAAHLRSVIESTGGKVDVRDPGHIGLHGTSAHGVDETTVQVASPSLDKPQDNNLRRTASIKALTLSEERRIIADSVAVGNVGSTEEVSHVTKENSDIICQYYPDDNEQTQDPVAPDRGEIFAQYGLETEEASEPTQPELSRQRNDAIEMED